MLNTFQLTFQHLLDASSLLNGGSIPPLPPLHPAPTNSPLTSHTPTIPLPNPNPTDTEMKLIQGSTYNSKNLLHAGLRYSKDGKPLVHMVEESSHGDV